MRKYTKFLCFFVAFCITACSAATPTPPPLNLSSPTQSSPDASNSVIYGRLTGNEQYPAVFLHESGERLVIIGEPGADRIRGVVYSSPNTPTMVIYVNEQGLPETGFVGEYILLYTNYTDTTVDVTVISPDGTINEYPALEFDKELLEYSEISTIPVTSNISFNTSATSINKDLLWYLKLASIALSVFGCVAAITLSAPLGLLCFGALLKIVPELLKAEKPESELIQPLENAGTALDTYQCLNVDVAACVDIFIDTAEISTVEANQTYVKQKRVVDEIKLKSSSSPIEGTLSCTDLSLTPEEKANCGTHSYQFENQVTSGDCYMTLDDGSLSKIKTGAFTMTFNFAINAVENQTEQGNATILQKRNINTYATEYGDGGSQELFFNISGFTWSGTDQSCSFLLTSTLTP